MPAAKGKKVAPLPANVLYHANLRAPISEEVNDTPKARVHRVEWNKIMDGQPVEINPSLGSGYKIMAVQEWSSRWKRNDDLPQCLRCGSKNTKEHHFTQTWYACCAMLANLTGKNLSERAVLGQLCRCRQKKKWESELLCLDCHAFSWRSYVDPDFLTPEQYQKKYWQQIASANVHRPLSSLA